jgi:hypothetical protein
MLSVNSHNTQLVSYFRKQTIESTQHACTHVTHMSQRDDFIESQKSVHAPASHTVQHMCRTDLLETQISTHVNGCTAEELSRPLRDIIITHTFLQLVRCSEGTANTDGQGPGRPKRARVLGSQHSLLNRKRLAEHGHCFAVLAL